MACELTFNNCVTSSKSDVLSKFSNSKKLTKKKACESQRSCGSGVICGKTMREIKRSSYYKQIPRGTIIDGRTVSRARKGALCKYIDRPMVLFLRLDPSEDNSNVLAPLTSFEDTLNRECKSFQKRFPLFKSFTQLMSILERIPNQTVGLITIITHGSKESIYVGGGISVKIKTNRFVQFAKQLGRVLMTNAQVLLVACSTGKVTQEPAEHADEKEDLIIFKDTNHNNFANQLSKVTGRIVFATPGQQTVNEIMVGKGSNGEYCKELFHTPVNFTYNSEKQKMYKFIQ